MDPEDRTPHHRVGSNFQDLRIIKLYKLKQIIPLGGVMMFKKDRILSEEKLKELIAVGFESEELD